MEVMMAVQSGTPLRALRVQLKRGVPALRGGDNNEVPQATQEKSRPSPSNCVTPFACKLLSEQGFELELELIQTQMAQKPMLRAEVGMRVRCANKASAE